MMLRKMAAALLLLTAAMPALADNKVTPKDAKTPSNKDSDLINPFGTPPAPAAATAASAQSGDRPNELPLTDYEYDSSDSLAPTKGSKQATKAELKARKQELSLDYALNPEKKPEKEQGSEKAKAEDLSMGTVCLFPFKQTDTLKGDEPRTKKELADIRKMFVNIANRTWPKRVHEFPNEQTTCTDYKHLDSCTAKMIYFSKGLEMPAGKGACAQVLIGEVTRNQDGYELDAGVLDVKSGKMFQAHRTTNTSSASQRQAWAQLHACNLFGAECGYYLRIDADLPELNVFLGDTLIQRDRSLTSEVKPFGPPGVYQLSTNIDPHPEDISPGIHKPIAQPSFLSKPVAMRDGDTVTVHVREHRDGTFDITFGNDDNPPPKSVRPPSKAAFILGVVGAGLGVVAEGFAVQQYAHSQSLANGATNDYNANGYYNPSDVAAVNSAHTAKTNSNISAIVGGVLIVAGAIVALVNHP